MNAAAWASEPDKFDPMAGVAKAPMRRRAPRQAHAHAPAAAPAVEAAPEPAKPAPQAITEFPRGDHHRNKPKSVERVAVERAFATAALQNESLTANQVGQRAGVTEAVARSVIDRLLVGKLLHKSGPRGSGYRWGAAPADSVAKEAVRYRPPPGNYDGRDLSATSCRPGAMDAYNLPSLQDGQAVPRRAPVLLGSAGPIAGKTVWGR